MLQIIRQAINEGKVIDEEKLIAGLSFDWGATRRTIREYLKTLELAGKIKRVEGEITTAERFDEVEELRNMDPEDLIKELQGGEEFNGKQCEPDLQQATASAIVGNSNMGVSEAESNGSNSAARDGVKTPENNA